MKTNTLRRMLSLMLVCVMVLTLLPTKSLADTFDKENFVGLLVKAESDVTMKFFKGHDRENTSAVIQPDYTETVDGITYYYFANISGAYCYDAKRSGDYTVYQRLYITSAEAATCNVHEVVMNKRAEHWDCSYYYGNTDEYLATVEYDISEKWHTEVPFVTPVFTVEGKAAQQMTTQPELVEFIQTRDDADDNMYIFSMGKSGTCGFDIPIVIFTKTDLSSCTTLEQVADKLHNSGLPNVSYKAQMHGDEHAAGEGALGVIDLLDQAENQYLLDDINIYVMPRINPDGAYNCKRNITTVIDSSYSNRDLNREMLTLNILEQRLYLRVVHLFDPIVEFDGHERQRTANVADIMYSTSWRDGSEESLLNVQLDLVNAMFDALEAVDLSGAWYNNKVNTCGTASTESYASAMGRIHILMESRGIYLGTEAYGSRTASHIVGVMSGLKHIAENKTAIVQALEAERQRQITSGETYEESDVIALDAIKTSDSKYDHTTEKFNIATGKVTSYVQPGAIYLNTKTRVAPTAYVLPANLPKISEILELMDLHEITYECLPANAAMDLQQYTGTVKSISLTPEQTFAFPEGAYVFKMNQANAFVLAMLMEPDCLGDDLVQQKRIVANGETFPIYRYIRDLNEGDVEYTIAPAAPTGLATTDATEQANDGIISGLDAGKLYEYKIPGDDVFTLIPAGTTQLTGLVPGRYQIRYQETQEQSASLSAICTVGCSVTVYLDASTGSDDNDGIAENTPLATMEGAYNKLITLLGSGGENIKGTIVLLDNYTITTTARLDLPAHGFPITILGKAQSVKLTFNPTVEGETTQQLAFHGDTTLDNLTFHAASTSKYDYIFACGHKFTIGENLKTTSARTTIFPNLVGGDYNASVVDTDMTILGGRWYRVYAGSFKGVHTGTAKLTVENAKVTELNRNNHSGTLTGDTVIHLKNVSMSTFYSAYIGNFSGNTTVVLGENTTGTFYTGNKTSGSQNGIVTFVADGVDLSKVTLINAPGTSNASGTVAKGVLVYASGDATPVAGFAEYHIDTDSTVNLVADLAVDKISGGGTVELNGYKLTGESVYAMAPDVNSVSLRPGAAGLYFTGAFDLNPELETVGYGIALSTEDETPVAEDNTTSLYTVGYNSVLVKDIMTAGDTDNSKNANMPIYARTYVKLADGTTIYNETVTVTLRQLVYAVDAKWDSLTAAQKEAVLRMYDLYAATMGNWKIPNIKANA